MRWINRAGTAVIAVAIVVGPPTAIAVWLRAQQWRFPTVADARAWMEQPLTAGMVAGLFGVVAAMVWLLLACAIVHRAWKALSGTVRRVRRRPLPTPAQMTAGSMAGVAALAMPSVVVDQPDGAVPASSPSPARQHPDSQASIEHAGVDLPGGGWVPYRTAVAVTVLGSAIWLYRRQHYQPRDPRHGGHDHDPDLQPLPVTAEAISAGLGDQRTSELVPGATLVPDLRPGLLVLTGPGAISGARGLLVTALLDSALATTSQAVVTVRHQDLDLLLDESRLAGLPSGLSVNATRSPEVVSGAGIDLHDLMGPIVVVQKRAAAQGGAEAVDGISTTIVVADDRRDGRPWHVAADGTVTADGMRQTLRLSQLERHAATDLLVLLQQHARTAPSPASSADGPATPVKPPPRPAELRLLGGCRLLVRGTTVQLRRSAGLQTLAYLAIHPDGATTNDLIRAIWPGLNPNTITKRLHTTLTALRQQLQPLLGDVVVRQDERYRLNPDAISTDLDTLRHAIHEATTAVTDRQRQAAAKVLIGADQGELAAGFTWPWIQRPREILRRDVIDAYLHLASTTSDGQVLELVRAATAADPYNEAVHREAQRILQTAGEHEAAQALGRGLAQRLLTARLHPTENTADLPST